MPASPPLSAPRCRHIIAIGPLRADAQMGLPRVGPKGRGHGHLSARAPPDPDPPCAGTLGRFLSREPSHSRATTRPHACRHRASRRWPRQAPEPPPPGTIQRQQPGTAAGPPWPADGAGAPASAPPFFHQRRGPPSHGRIACTR
ncbi:hypothetical protein TNIN_500421 [Trichonephila inaurata madagascariensis]|uniref:Uncharacterized protein n=1 Tax=Trichonephila inaurata madagascariensis TaxID=2747483 RepID=A0A8X7C594_9ARAC|nr:hypothetical protein TNIN_500421 [Trichonephila inaurata madagascariensis]